VRGLDVEERCELRLEDTPLVEPKTIHDHEDGGPALFDDREQELGGDVDRQRGPIALEGP
jgi:hypothetical protein